MKRRAVDFIQFQSTMRTVQGLHQPVSDLLS